MGARHLAHDSTAVYRLWDDAGALLYIGITANLARRLQQHRRKPWFPLVASQTVEWHPDRLTAHAVELAAIMDEEPSFNRARGHIPLSILKPLETTDADTDDESLAGQREIELMLGVSRQRVQQLVKRDDFPRPIARLAMGAVWRRRDVERWAQATGRIPKN